MRLIFRVFVKGVKRYEETVEGADGAVYDMLPELAASHIAMLGRESGMIEIECPDEPNENERFVRIGSDPSGMVLPIEVTLN